MAGEAPEQPAADERGPAVADPSIDALAAALAERYAIESLLGRGATASVYLAHDRRHGRRIALKVLHDALGSAVGVGRFQREIRVAAWLQHPNILPLFDPGADAGRLWYTTPLVEPGSLRDRRSRGRPRARARRRDRPPRHQAREHPHRRRRTCPARRLRHRRRARSGNVGRTLAHRSGRYHLLKAEAAWFGGDDRARMAHADSARRTIEAAFRAAPRDGRLLSRLGVIYSFLGRHEEAVRTGRRAMELLPLTRDADSGPFLVSNLARSYMLAGQADSAIALLHSLGPVSSWITPAELRTGPTWDPLRDHPRFRELMATNAASP